MRHRATTYPLPPGLRLTAHKSLAAAAGTLLAGLGLSLLDGGLSWHETATAAGAALSAAAAAWRISNRVKAPAGDGIAEFTRPREWRKGTVHP